MTRCWVCNEEFGVDGVHICANAPFKIKPAEPAVEPPSLSPTAGMNIAQRILHVGGRNNAAGYVEFGSIQAVEALVRQVLRDLPPPPPAQPVVEYVTWQLIETAPKDGTEVLLRSKNGRIANGSWIAVNGEVGYWAWALINQEPIHWMPIPYKSLAPPAEVPLLSDDEIYEMYSEPRSDAEMLAFGREVEVAVRRKAGL